MVHDFQPEDRDKYLANYKEYLLSLEIAAIICYRRWGREIEGGEIDKTRRGAITIAPRLVLSAIQLKNRGG
jgi:hypothetical protein